MSRWLRYSKAFWKNEKSRFDSPGSMIGSASSKVGGLYGPGPIFSVPHHWQWSLLDGPITGHLETSNHSPTPVLLPWRRAKVPHQELGIFSGHWTPSLRRKFSFPRNTKMGVRWWSKVQASSANVTPHAGELGYKNRHKLTHRFVRFKYVKIFKY